MQWRRAWRQPYCWFVRTTPSHFTWFAMQVILPSVVPSCNLTMRAVSESCVISCDRWSQRKNLSVVRQGVVSNKLCTHQVLGTLAWWTYICLIHRSCVAAHSKIESTLVLTDGTLAFFFFQHNVFTHYKPSNTNILLDALSRRSSVRVETPGSR